MEKMVVSLYFGVADQSVKCKGLVKSNIIHLYRENQEWRNKKSEIKNRRNDGSDAQCMIGCCLILSYH